MMPARGIRPAIALPVVLAALAAAGCGAASGDEQTQPGGAMQQQAEAGKHEHTNRLIHESSPYLLQHAHNPVDWYPWGKEAFARAKKENKPIFLSIGYSTCHWCHVMERESFENEEIAAILNEHFVSIKVDREERPDLDAVYMAAVQAMTGRGGWPMSLFLTPDGRPFFGGTYFPPEDRFNRPGFHTLLVRVAEVWREKHDDLLGDAERLTEHLRGLDRAPGSASLSEASLNEASLGEATLDLGYRRFAQVYDERHGGFGSAPKFPRTHNLSFLLRYWKRSGERKALDMVTATLGAMWRGGMHDHVGGGFHRYSTDGEWLVPHFEKMLYDQALIARTCVEAYQATGEERFAAMARDLFAYVLRDLADPAGGFQSAEDADSEGVEGKFYLWTRKEILDLLGPEEGATFCSVYGVEAEGNFHDEASGVRGGGNILHLPRPIEEAAGRLGTEPRDLEARLRAMREKLLQVRARRVRPLKDDKVLADWNGLMISALAAGGRALGEERYVQAARRAADFLLESMLRDGRLLHRWRAGKAAIPGFLDDYAFVCLGLLDLYEATFEEHWLEECSRLAGEMTRLFGDGDGKGKGFFFSAGDSEKLLKRTREIYDGAVPSGNSVAALVLERLGRLTVRPELETRGRGILEGFAAQIAAGPTAHPFALQALDFAVGPTREIVLAGRRGDPALEALVREVEGRFLPNKVLAFHPDGTAGKRIEAIVPFLAGQGTVGGKATAYVCENYACKLPVTTPAGLARLLDAR